MNNKLPDHVFADFLQQVNHDIVERLTLKASLIDDPEQRAAIFFDVGMWSLSFGISIMSNGREGDLECLEATLPKVLERCRKLRLQAAEYRAKMEMNEEAK